MHAIGNALYPRVAVSVGSSSGISAQAFTVVGTTTASFTAFSTYTQQVFFDVQNADVVVTLDGTSPVLGSRGHRLPVGTNYTWNASVASSAKFVSTGTSSFLFCQEIAI